MKKLFLSLFALAVAIMSFAQSSTLATLSHNGSISAYYGSSAFKSAMDAAESGDVITLSSGQFQAVNITKAVKLRGAGMSISSDSNNGHESTVIQGSLTINIDTTQTERLVVEGLYFNNNLIYSGKLNNAQFLKCRFSSISNTNSSSVITNTSFINCRIAADYHQHNDCNTIFINCIVNNPYSKSSSSLEFDNCFVKFGSFYGQSEAQSTYYKNCIIQDISGCYPMPSNCTAFNCVGLGVVSFQNMTNNTNKKVDDITSVFKTYSSTTSSNIPDDEKFVLTETAASTYLGTDGTQVGIYGGSLPYDENPVVPRITKCNIASKSTADGKLSVEIEVKAADY